MRFLLATLALLLTCLPISAQADESTPVPNTAFVDDMAIEVRLTSMEANTTGGVTGYCADVLTFDARLTVEWFGEDSWLGESFRLQWLEALSVAPDGYEDDSPSGIRPKEGSGWYDSFSLDEDGPTSEDIGFSLALEQEHTQLGMEVRIYYGKDLRYDIKTDSYYNVDAGWTVTVPPDAVAEAASKTNVCWEE